MGGQRSTFRGPMVLHLGGQWSGANGIGGRRFGRRATDVKNENAGPS